MNPHLFRMEHSETRTTNGLYGEFFRRDPKIPVQPELIKILHHVDLKRDKIEKNLKDLIEIPSISGCENHVDDCIKAIKHTEQWLIKLGMKYECFHIGKHFINNKEYDLPSVILASYRKDDIRKKTICVYAHLDVPNPDLEQWQTDPWNLTLIDNTFYGSGVAAGKSSIICWFNMLKTFQKCKMDVPVNIKFIIESMHHSNSEGLIDFLRPKKKDFFANVNLIIICDGEWIGEKRPCILFGSVGMLHFDLFVEKISESQTDIREDMDKICSRFCDEEEVVTIPHFHDLVKDISPTEEKIVESITDFDIDEIRKELPPFKKSWSQLKLLMHFWRLPSIWFGETEECNCEKNDTSKIRRHFIVKIVPKQIEDKTLDLVMEHIRNLVMEFGIENEVTCVLASMTRPWLESLKQPYFLAIKKATVQVYKESPNFIREDKSRLILTILTEILEKNILLIPMGGKSSNIGDSNENIHKRNFYESLKLLAAFICQYSKT